MNFQWKESSIYHEENAFSEAFQFLRLLLDSFLDIPLTSGFGLAEIVNRVILILLCYMYKFTMCKHPNIDHAKQHKDEHPVQNLLTRRFYHWLLYGDR